MEHFSYKKERFVREKHFTVQLPSKFDMAKKEDRVKLLLEHLARRAEQVGAPQKPYYHQQQPISHQGRYDHQQPIDNDQGYYCRKPVLKDHGPYYYQPNVHHVTYDHVVPQTRRAGAVMDCNEGAKQYNGVVIKEPQRPQVPQTRRAGAVMDCNEAAKQFNGVVIKEFGRNK